MKKEEMTMDKNETVEILKELPERIAAVIMPSDRFFDYKGALDFAIKTIEADRWISVKDRLPEKEGRCLVFTDYGDVTMDSYRGGLFVCNLGNVTHWKPLPKAPESEDK